MALPLRLRRAIVVTSASFLRTTAFASTYRHIPLVPFVPLPRPWPLPGAAGGFRSPAVGRRGYGAVADNSKVSPHDTLCDNNHWLIVMNFPDPSPSREEMIETYLQTLSKVVGSYEEAKRSMYAFSTTTYTGFQALVTEEMSLKFRGLPRVVLILPDAYLYPEKKEFGGDKYDNGVITPSRPFYDRGKSSRPDRNIKFQKHSPQQAGSMSSQLQQETSKHTAGN
ncbi:unnamed protein product [Urochloa humidicola]